MSDQERAQDGLSVNIIRELKEEEEEDFRSCFEDDEVWKEAEEPPREEPRKCVLDDQFSVKLFFKGISMNEVGDSSSGLSGIGVVMERSADFPVIRVQKKLDFYVDESVADYLALMDGIVEALENNIRHVYAFTDSEIFHDQIKDEENLETPLLVALRQRILEHVSNLNTFVLNVVPSVDLEGALRLAQVAIGLVSSPVKGDKSRDNCSICCEDKPSPMMITMKCSHKFCSHCMRTYIDGKLKSSQVPIRCPQLRCKYQISKLECRAFLPLTSYESLERVLAEANLNSEKIYCPFPNCSVLLDPQECLSARASSSSQSDSSCIECPVCQRFICVECGVPWHSSFTCEEYQNLPIEERDASDITLHRLAQNNRWRRCRQCRRMIELMQGCYHMTCWDGQQICQCAFWDEDVNSEDSSVSRSAQVSEQWAWETFNSFPMIMDAYSDQERSQLALIQRFLAGGFSLSDHNTYQQASSPPRCTDSYGDAIKDLHQLPWLESFVSVISDDFYEDYMQ
ncbi:uncharacterized protein LOC116214033 isoform X2 [Punica granatum]|uniref:RBR-type E3 ubiquitin transferase n=1 Tax=Punica granatum TaxID=22663 RepID=A0A6P8EDW4_PUNGR|nr:uncharacterized protein LOC116214033 isoform X2 [Punica granatum]